jgi:hypothetical protein
MVRDHYRTFATFLTPLGSHCLLPLNQVSQIVRTSCGINTMYFTPPCMCNIRANLQRAYLSRLYIDIAPISYICSPSSQMLHKLLLTHARGNILKNHFCTCKTVFAKGGAVGGEIFSRKEALKSSHINLTLLRRLVSLSFFISVSLSLCPQSHIRNRQYQSQSVDNLPHNYSFCRVKLSCIGKIKRGPCSSYDISLSIFSSVTFSASNFG